MSLKCLALVVFVAMVFSTEVDACNRFCKDKHGKFYCCETPKPTPPPHPGRCPPSINTSCFQAQAFGDSGVGYEPPKNCKIDHDCGNRFHKCCYDNCIRDHICKPSI